MEKCEDLRRRKMILFSFPLEREFFFFLRKNHNLKSTSSFTRECDWNVRPQVGFLLLPSALQVALLGLPPPAGSSGGPWGVTAGSRPNAGTPRASHADQSTKGCGHLSSFFSSHQTVKWLLPRGWNHLSCPTLGVEIPSWNMREGNSISHQINPLRNTQCYSTHPLTRTASDLLIPTQMLQRILKVEGELQCYLIFVKIYDYF